MEVSKKLDTSFNRRERPDVNRLVLVQTCQRMHKTLMGPCWICTVSREYPRNRTERPHNSVCLPICP